MSHNLLQGLLQELGAPMPGRSRRTMRDKVRLVIGLKYLTDDKLPLGGEENVINGFDGLNEYDFQEFQGVWNDGFGANDFGANRYDSDQFEM